MHACSDLELTFTQTISCPWTGGQTVDVAIREGGRVCMVSEENKVRMFDLSFCLFVPPHSYLYMYMYMHMHMYMLCMVEF